jgi:hypothetical protein
MTEPVRIENRAFDNLHYIRTTMERAGAFTAVPGWGGVAMGSSALVAAWVAAQQSTDAAWLRVWLIELVAGLLLAGGSLVWKARRARVPLIEGPARRFVIGFVPPVLAGGVLTWALAASGQHGMLPAVWLLMYGSGTIAGGSASVRAVPIMGGLFFLLGLLALPMVTDVSGDVWMAAGFGLLHIVFGGIIAWRYGG